MSAEEKELRERYSAIPKGGFGMPAEEWIDKVAKAMDVDRDAAIAECLRQLRQMKIM